MFTRVTAIRILKPLTIFSTATLVVGVLALIRNAQLNFSSDLAESFSRLIVPAFILTVVSSIALKVVSKQQNDGVSGDIAQSSLIIAGCIGIACAAVFGFFMLAFRNWGG